MTLGIGTADRERTLPATWVASAIGATVLGLYLVFLGHRGLVVEHDSKGVFAVAVLMTTLPVYVRIRRYSSRRATWSLLLVSEVLTAVAGLLYGSLPQGANPFSAPNLNLFLSLVISVLAVTFVMLIAYASLRVLDNKLLIDALAGGLSISALLALLYMHNILSPVSRSPGGAFGTQHFVLGAGIIVILLVSSTALTMVDVTGDYLLIYISVGAVIVSTGEILAHQDIHRHSTRWGLLIDLCWLAAYLVAGRAASMDDGSSAPARSRTERTFADGQSRKIALFGVLAIIVITLAALLEDPPVVGGLALAALAALLVRLLMSLRAERIHSRVTEALAVTDPLTGLYNRRGLSTSSLSASSEVTSSTGGVVVIDLDNFKEVNDSLGHSAGDIVLGELGRRLRDSLGSDVIVARLGGDEFAISRLTGSLEEMQQLAGEALALIRDPIHVEGLLLHLSASAGVAMRDEGHSDVEEFIRKADVAMYWAKKNHSGVKVYDFEHDRNDPSRLVLYSMVSAAVQGGNFDVALQPLLDVKSERVVGCEALARWSPVGYGPIPPERFIPMIELQGLIVPFTAQVLRKSLAGVAPLSAMGLDQGLNFNVSESDFVNADFPRVVRHALREHDFPARNLTIEITEGVLANEDVRVKDCIQELRSIGVRISVDDFGTGYSAMSKLVDFPVDELKIDQSFTSRMLTNANAGAIVRATVKLAREMGLRTVAEGVESREVYEAMAELGVDAIQGYYIARPMPAVAYVDYLKGVPPRGDSVDNVGLTLE